MKIMLCLLCACFLVAGCKNSEEAKRINAEENRAANNRMSSPDAVKANIAHLEKAVQAKPDDYITKFRLAVQSSSLGGQSNFDKAYSLCTDISQNAPEGVIKTSAKRMLKDMKEKPDLYRKGIFNPKGQYIGFPEKQAKTGQ